MKFNLYVIISFRGFSNKLKLHSLCLTSKPFEMSELQKIDESNWRSFGFRKVCSFTVERYMSAEEISFRAMSTMLFLAFIQKKIIVIAMPKALRRGNPTC